MKFRAVKSEIREKKHDIVLVKQVLQIKPYTGCQGLKQFSQGHFPLMYALFKENQRSHRSQDCPSGPW